MRLIILLSVLAWVLHLTLAIPLERAEAINNLSTVDCAGGINTSKVQSVSVLVVCSEPVDPNQDTLYQAFLLAQSDLVFLIKFRAHVLHLPTDLLFSFGDEGDSMYGLFKQASKGDITLYCPKLTMDPNERRKVGLWGRYEGMGCEEARAGYVEQTRAFLENRYESGMLG